MIPTSKRPTVEILYKLFSPEISPEKYEPYGYYCIESDFIPSYVTEIKTLKEDELYIQPEKKFILTTIGAHTKN